MKLSRVGILILLTTIVIAGTSCSTYNRWVARRNLVDGVLAYKDRKFSVAEGFFRKAVAIDPEAKTEEGKKARSFLARTLNSIYVGNRSEASSKAIGEEAVKLYRASVTDDVNDQSSFNAVANLYQTFAGQYPEEKDKWTQELEKWTTERADNTNVEAKYRADAYSSLASKQYTCANEISDTEAVKKTVKEEGKDVFKFSKPEKPEDFEKFKQCVQKGTELVDKAVALENDQAKSVMTAVIDKNTSDADMSKITETTRIWAKVWSFKASMSRQAMRLADMEGNADEKNSFKTKAEEQRAKFLEYLAVEKKIETEKERRQIEKDPSMANANAANGANANAANGENTNTNK
ncbi:MAG TPA: hypothetical protein PKE69_09595 [Pyrinomonadaceae bacterium]|nr:hypothetical protein [Pyrinomonadaceae bacterium]